MIVMRPIEHFGDDLAGWYWSEKIDGFRCLWNGFQFQSRSGKRFDAPQAWVDAMTKQPLDGELFAGSWNATASAIKSGDWSALKFHVFDVPESGRFEDRIAKIPLLPDFCVKVEHNLVFSTAHALTLMRDVSLDGGEGIVCRCPDGCHAPVKLKPSIDTEGTVVGYGDGASYVIEKNGVRFPATHSGERMEVGTLVTFRCKGFKPDGTAYWPHVKGARMFD